MTQNAIAKVLLKDVLFNEEKVRKIAREVFAAEPTFNREEFVRDVVTKFSQLELKARIEWIAVSLMRHVPGEYERAVRVLLKALPSPNDPRLSDNDYGDFIYASYAEFVAKNGCTREHLQLSLKALYEITQRFSAEDAIRYFINAFPQETLEKLLEWTEDDHYHVRRLCSEGTRPKLPWSQKINIPVSAALPILNRLYCDKTRFVTRSVANHLNDISKTDPKLVIGTLTKWRKSKSQSSAEMDYIVRHALRTLVKQGNPKAMKVLGFDHASPVSISKFSVPAKVKMNTALEFSFHVKSEEDASALIDYSISFRDKKGKLKERKVFKLTTLVLTKNTPVIVSKRHILRQYMTTRTLYPGQHEIEIQINGKICAKGSFDLT